MNNAPDDIQDKMKALQASYLDSLKERRTDILTALESLKGRGGDDARAEALELIRHHAHKTAGSGATFGFSDISVAAKKLELICDTRIEQGAPLDEGVVAELEPLAADLLAVMDAAGSGAALPVASASVEMGEGRFARARPQPHENKIIVIVGTDADNESGLATGVANFGYTVETVSTLADALSRGDGADAGPTPAALIVDHSPDAVPADQNISEALGCPVIFLLDRDTLADRLSAVRAGAETCFLKPVRMVELVDALDRLTLADETEPYRILVVDDDASVSNFNEAVLKGTGMITRAINEPSDILSVLDDFSPEIILMDLYMPNCDGQELASVIRQKEEFAGIPIVFLSSETDVHKQISAMSHGGDGFLTKPITPRHLIEYVMVRAKRFRMLRNLMVRDSLTGLYNHTTTKQLLENEIARSERDKGSLCFAMVDIDHFKAVNDTYGHGVGDQVIKSLSRLLKQRLRATDIVGRMGGEEFGVILPGATGELAERIMNDIRVAFSEISQLAESETFHRTFSCGVAEHRSGGTGQTLSESADKALYIAKEGGRNRVILSED